MVEEFINIRKEKCGVTDAVKQNEGIWQQVFCRMRVT